jgi:hypothetical protein
MPRTGTAVKYVDRKAEPTNGTWRCRRLALLWLKDGEDGDTAFCRRVKRKAGGENRRPVKLFFSVGSASCLMPDRVKYGGSLRLSVRLNARCLAALILVCDSFLPWAIVVPDL